MLSSLQFFVDPNVRSSMELLEYLAFLKLLFPPTLSYAKFSRSLALISRLFPSTSCVKSVVLRALHIRAPPLFGSQSLRLVGIFAILVVPSLRMRQL